MAHQSLYRRYRPQRFEQVRGQEHLVRALRNAVAAGRVGHAYLFSGPRGTGKTTTARILAKALNCPDLSEGEPCGVCDSCLSIERGTSFDLQELDAASNRGIGEMRALLETIALGTPGRTKVYILDEVHMLTKEAAAALLKTLEEPPPHVVFVLATTDPQKVLPTIRSRTQHFELTLLPASELRELVDDVIADAGLEVTPEQIDYVLRKGGGSARDTLSMLDQVASAGSAPEGGEGIDSILDGLAEHDPTKALAGVQAAMTAGREPRVIGESLVEWLRDAFLVSMNVEVGHLTERDLARASALGRQMGARALTRALELLGTALVDLRQAPDPRVPLEVALLRITRPEADSSVAALHDRIDRLERLLAGGVTPGERTTGRDRPTGGDSTGAGTEASTTPSDAPSVTTDGSPAPGPAAEARRALSPTNTAPALGAVRSKAAKATASAAAAPGVPVPDDPGSPPVVADEPSPPVAAEDAPDPGTSSASAPGPLPTRDELTLAWGDVVLDKLTQRTRTRWSSGRFLEVADDAAIFGLPNDIHRKRAEEQRSEVEQVLADHFGRRVPLRLVVDTGSAPPPDALDPVAVVRPDRSDDLDPAEIGPVHELEDAHDEAASGLSRLTDAFPGAEVLEVEEVDQ